jgi:hypothetical protein
LSSAPDASHERRSFRVTHPFHPLFGREFELVNISLCWGDERVFYLDETEQVRSLPARWSSAVEEDAFVTVSAGRSDFRVADLLALAELVRGCGRMMLSGFG